MVHKSYIVNCKIVHLLLCLLLCACTPAPTQRAHRLHDTAEPDSVMLRQMQINIHMADLADKQCLQALQQDSLRYSLDDYGFWLTRTQTSYGDSLHTGENCNLHLRIYDLSNHLIADTQDDFSIGSDQLPTAIRRTLLQARHGEQYILIAPWYTAYGVEGTQLIPPYSNLRIFLHIAQ